MGNCSNKELQCFFCKTKPNGKIYVATINHPSKLYGGKNLCSLCLEQKVLEKYQMKPDCNDILPVNIYHK